MERKTVARGLTGTTSTEPRAYEIENRAAARQAAADGMVLLRNSGGILPLDKAKPVALYGAGAVNTVKGGTGSGDVNSRPTVSIWQGLKNAGYQITSESWLQQYEADYAAEKAAWRDLLFRKAAEAGAGSGGDPGPGFYDIFISTPFIIPAGSIPTQPDPQTDTAIVVLARTAGEGADRFDVPGDYRLTDDEQALLDAVCSLYAHVILVINSGSLIDLGFTDAPQAAPIEAILYINQPGMEAGNAFADVLSGTVNPSAKLTDTWALSCADYPNAATFSHCNGNVTQEEYTEGIYVGYRYFDTFEIPVRYGFGFGLSYTDFKIQPAGLDQYAVGTARPEIGVTVCVTNEGTVPGREVVQVYASCPQGRQRKEFRRLVGFAKTELLPPGASQNLEVRFPLGQLASFDAVLSGWVMEAGPYILMAGSSLQDAQTAGILTAEQDLIYSRTDHICPVQAELQELQQDGAAASSIAARRSALLEEALHQDSPMLFLRAGDVQTTVFAYNGAHDNTPQEVRDFVDTLTVEQLILLSSGDAQQGSAGPAVPGAAAQTSDCAAAQGLAAIMLADGPAGLHLNREYQVVNGVRKTVPFLAALDGANLLESPPAEPGGETRHQYCTAFPVGTQLAQSWDLDVLRRVGAAVAKELVEFGVTLWLAPGMNIHRNPLCGRNFEYYSEDPLVSGLMAAAMTQGVQSVPGVGTTIKHFACNNQEDNRMGSDSIISERTLREIYLHGFEIAVTESQPMAIMTSYNLINGVHAANCYDLCTKAARCEWGFKGVIMTDWTTTMRGPDCTAAGCMRAGNDLVMPGAPSDHENIRQELDAGTLSLDDLKRSVARLVNIVWQSRYSVAVSS